MINCIVDERDIRKLEEARNLVVQVNESYYMCVNSTDLYSRLNAITYKLQAIIAEARDHNARVGRFWTSNVGMI